MIIHLHAETVKEADETVKEADAAYFSDVWIDSWVLLFLPVFNG